MHQTDVHIMLHEAVAELQSLRIKAVGVPLQDAEGTSAVERTGPSGMGPTVVRLGGRIGRKGAGGAQPGTSPVKGLNLVARCKTGGAGLMMLSGAARANERRRRLPSATIADRAPKRPLLRQARCKSNRAAR